MQRTWLLIAMLGMSGCAMSSRSPKSPPAPPSSTSFVREQLIVHTDFELPRQHRLLDEVTALRRDIADKLSIPASDEPIHVYVFESPEKYEQNAAKYFSAHFRRRAFFVETDTRLNVYAQWGDHVAEDLRHEVTHGYLHASIRNLPLWLDEGLAEYFEVPRGRKGLNSPHLELLEMARAQGDWSPDLARLEQLTSAAKMSQLDYAEAWLWMHWLLESTPQRREVLCGHLENIRLNGEAPPLSIKLREVDSSPHRSVAEHLSAIQGK